MHEIDKVAINFDEGQLFLLNLCLTFLMFGIALDLNFKDFKYVFQRPKSVIIGLTSQLVLLPFLTLLIIFLWQPPASIQLGMLMVAVCPGGNVSNYFVHRSNGNTALSISLTSIVTFTAVILTPLSFVLFSRILGASIEQTVGLSVDLASMIWLFCQLVLLPLVLGMLINYYLPKLRDLIVKPARWFSILLLIGIIVFALGSNVYVLQHHLQTVFLLVLIHNSLALLTGYYFSKLNSLSLSDTKAVTIETGIQNSGLGLILIFNYFDGLGGMAVVAAWWGVWHLISGLAISTYWAKTSAPPISAPTG
ncbi:MAG: bile acid:sodium symporter family protein [Saprospiraceae bacterium]|nr:bile acid:sodium symporter family protein [Saprospiraceae bacterium]